MIFGILIRVVITWLRKMGINVPLPERRRKTIVGGAIEEHFRRKAAPRDRRRE